VALALAALLAQTALAATPKPAWSVQSLAAPTNFKPGDEVRIWVADTGNNRVQDWPFPTGVPTFASSVGSPGTGAGQFNHPGDVAVDSEGNVWVVDRDNNRVQEFDEGGGFLNQFGSAGTGNGQFSAPAGIAIDGGGSIWVADTGNNRVQKFNASGQYLSQFGSTGGSSGKFSSPSGIAVDPKGNIWVVDRGNNRVQEFNAAGEFEGKFGSAGAGNGQFSGPTDIAAANDGSLWVVDRGNNRVQKFNASGAYVAQFGSAGSGNGQLNQPTSLSLDASGSIWVADTGNNRVQKFSTAGAYLAQFGSVGPGNGQFSGPEGIAVDASEGDYHYEIFLANSGSEPSDGTPIEITDTLPAGLEVRSLLLETPGAPLIQNPSGCKTVVSAGQSTVECKIEGPSVVLYPNEQLRLVVNLTVPGSVSGSLTNHVQVEGGGAASSTATSQNEANPSPAAAGFEEFEATLTGVDGNPVSDAAAHPYQYTTRFAVNLKPAPLGAVASFVPAGGDLKQVEVGLPPGLVGNPTAVARCTAVQFNTIHGGPKNSNLNECPDGSAVGVIAIRQLEGSGQVPLTPIYNLVPPKGMPAQFGFQVLGLPVYINTKLRSDGDYGITAYVDNATEAKRVTAAAVTIWGVPGEESHDRMRGACTATGGSCPAEEGAPRPFLRLPTSCADSLTTIMSFDSWSTPGAFHSQGSTEAALTSCDAVDFSPSIEAKPTTNVADSPAGLHVDVHIPQAENEDPEGLAEADLRDARVTLPEGLLVNPSSADGLAGCSESQIGFEGKKEGRNSFSLGAASCPDASKLGVVDVDTPLVDHPLPGAVYLAMPYENPFDSLLAIYIAVYDPQTGVVVKLPGHVEPDPQTGQLTTTVEASPQTPFEDFKLDFFAGARASLRTPATCKTHTTTTSLTPYSAPASGPSATPSDSFAIASTPGGGSCPTTPGAEPNSPSFEAGTANPVAGAYSPFILRLARQDGSQEFKGLNVTLPPGLVGKLAGVASCSDSSLAAASHRSGKEELASSSCPPGSKVGTATVGAGAGPGPYHVRGTAYLAGPYKGAPLSMAVITPAVAGPFDLGTVVVRVAVQIDPETARITAVSDPLPTILEGIPLDVRSIVVRLDRDQFTLNPTSCEVKSVEAEEISALGQVAHLSNRFQVGGCRNLGFKPNLSLRLKGGTKRGDNPALRATVTYPKGAYANIAFARVALPHSVFLDQSHIRTICTRVQFAAKQCPPGAIYGYARATTPLLDAPLEGPVYLRSSSNPLPDLVADLNGQINVVLVGRTDSFHAGIRNTFSSVPDAPVSKFFLELRGGKRGLLVNSTDICRRAHRAGAHFVAQNGRVSNSQPTLKATCKKKPKRGKQHHKR
jgi:sugar lactone lactonase YvrE